MKIKLTILEKDKVYLRRLVEFLNEKYSDNFEIASFSDLTMALEHASEAKIDLLLVGDSFEVDALQVPAKCGIAYLVDSKDIAKYNNMPAICRFQKANLIQKQILDAYSENAGSTEIVRVQDGESRVIIFSSPCGGTGTSSMAAAMAVRYASMGLRTIYVNFENYGSSDVIFSCEGQFNMTSLVNALTSRNANVSMKLENCVKQDQCGVYFFSEADLAIHMVEFTADMKKTLLDAIKKSGAYDLIVVDMDFGIDKGSVELMSKAKSIVMVCDGSQLANTKVSRAYKSLSKLENAYNAKVTDKMCVVYNKFSKATSDMLNIGVTSPGGVGRFDHASTLTVVNELAKNNLFDEIIR